MKKATPYIKQLLKAILPHGIHIYYKKRKQLLSTSSIQDVSERKRIAFITPPYTNEYIQLIKNAITESNYEVTDNPEDAGYVWVHWYEDIKSTDDFLQKISNIKTWKTQGRKIIYQIHNKVPHEPVLPRLARAQMVALADTADVISSHSTDTLKTVEDLWDYGSDFSKVVQIPHPNYIGTYGKKLLPSKSLTNNTLRVLFFGIIKQYKGIENLIEATKNITGVEVTICGLAPDIEYKKKLEKLVEGRSDIRISFDYVDNVRVPQLLSEHHILALPYLLKSSLNSGAAMLAFSYGRTVVGSNNGTLKDLPKELHFGYDYQNEDDNTVQLREAIAKIQQRYSGHYSELLAIGDRVYDFVQQNNSSEKVASAINKMIQVVDE